MHRAAENGVCRFKEGCAQLADIGVSKGKRRLTAVKVVPGCRRRSHTMSLSSPSILQTGMRRIEFAGTALLCCKLTCCKKTQLLVASAPHRGRRLSQALGAYFPNSAPSDGKIGE